MAKQTNRHDDLRHLLERLNLGGMATVFAELALKAAKENLSHEAYLFELARHEEEQRHERRTLRLLRASGLPADKTFRTFQAGRLTPQLQVQIERLKDGSFLQSATNVIALGKPGVGKTRPTHYPYRSNHATTARDGHGGRSVSSALWTNASVRWDCQFSVSGALLYCLDSPHH
jgi:hypothetical protein